MRLLQRRPDGTLRLTSVLDDLPPRFAILSHTWGQDGQEIVFKDIDGTSLGSQTLLRQKTGYAKVDFCLRQAERDGITHVWIDTCCINKDSQTETNKAINWMFRWYAAAEKCYVFLPDVSKHKRRCSDAAQPSKWQDDFKSSRWFTRGWTLQELLAPATVEFYSREGDMLGDKVELASMIESTTKIDISALRGKALTSFTTQERFNWASHRTTKEPEDRVYSLFGVLNVSFPPNYGEGEQAALKRLRAALVQEFSGDLLVMDFHQGYQDHDRVRNVTMIKATGSSTKDDGQWLKVVLKALSFDQQDVRKWSIQPQTAKTCEWLLQHQLWCRWRACQDDSRLLWIKGHPGAGKSTIMKFADAQAVNDEAQNEIIISFYFNARGALLERSVEGMYRSLLCQLIEAVEPEELASSARALRSYKIADTGDSWPISTLQMFFGAVANSLEHRRLTVFVDALDECNDDEVRDMLYFLEELGLNSVESGRQVSMCFASRYYPNVILPSALELRLDQEIGHTEDLETYVNKALRIGNDERAQSIKARLLTKANGIFIWAVLVIKILNTDYNNGRVSDLTGKLERLPRDMGALFRQMTKRDDSHVDDLVLGLQWILFAPEPLTPMDFYALMLAGEGDEPLDNALSGLTEGDALRYLSHATKGLAEVSNRRVQFVHETVRDFLLIEGGLAELWRCHCNLESSSHERLKNICMRHLDLALTSKLPARQNTSLVDCDVELRTQRELAVVYAETHAITHAESAAEHISQMPFLQEYDLDFWQAVIDLHGTFLSPESRWSRPPTMLHLLMKHGAARLVQTLLSITTDELEVKDDGGNTPLSFACVIIPSVTAVLLAHGADVLSVNSSGETALHIATFLSREHELLRALLMKQADPTAKDNRGRTPLDHVLVNDNSEMFMLLLNHVNDATKVMRRSWSWLHVAAEAGSVQILSSLLATAETVDERTIEGYTPLHVGVTSSKSNTERIVSTLLDRGADVEAVDQWRRTPLMLACSSRTQASEKLATLLEHGANVNAIDAQSYTPFMHAVRSPDAIGCLSVLLEAMADGDGIAGQVLEALRMAEDVSHHIYRRAEVVGLLRSALEEAYRASAASPMTSFSRSPASKV